MRDKPKHKESSRSSILFYTVMAYILAFSFWWGYLLYQKNEIEYREKIQLSRINYNLLGHNEAFETSDEYAGLVKKMQRQRVMILSEGLFFLSLLAVGLVLVRRSFSREMRASRLQRNFLLSITHELKSPLASIKLGAQTMVKHPDLDKEVRMRLLNNNLADADRLEGLVENVLMAAKFENQAYQVQMERINFTELVQDVANNYQNYMGSNRQIRCVLSKDQFVSADRTGMISVVSNLIENALKYSSGESEVCIRLFTEENKVVLCIEDVGIGLSEEDKRFVFDRFYRVGNEDTRHTKGTGLGLYIVKNILDRHRASISVRDNKPRGTIFEVRMQVS